MPEAVADLRLAILALLLDQLAQRQGKLPETVVEQVRHLLNVAADV